MFSSIFNIFSQPYFKSKDQEALSALQSEYVKALLERSKNPSDFDANIECLRKFEKMHLKWKKIIQPYIVDVKSKLTAKEESLKILFPKEAEDFTQGITKDSRITKVGVVDQKEGPGLDYIIYFSDGSELKLKSLAGDALDNDKNYFTKKMEALQKQKLCGLKPH